MKAVIVECSNGAAVALCDDGSFRKLKNKGYSIGQELLIRQKAPTNRMVQKLSMCASLALVLLSFAGIGSYSYVNPYTYVSLDINPSIEYALNRYDKVISVSGINDEGQQIVSSIEADVKNQNITTALGVTIGQLEKDNYIIHEKYNHVIVSVYSSNDSKAQSITSRVNTLSAEKSDICSIDAIPVSKEVKDDADSLGITPGKLALIHAVAETTSDTNFKVSDWTDKTVSELETTIQQASSQTPDSGIAPASASVINSEYLSNALDSSAANKPDKKPTTAGAVEADKEAGSASTDNQTTTDDTAAEPGASGVSASKPDSNTAAPSTDGSTGSTDTSNTSSADTGNPNGAANQNTPANENDKNHSSGNDDSDKSGTSSSKDTAQNDKDSGSSPSKNDPSSASGNKNEADGSLTEDSSSKKDSYPAPGTDTLEEPSNGVNPGETSPNAGIPTDSSSNHNPAGTGPSDESQPSQPDKAALDDSLPDNGLSPDKAGDSQASAEKETF